MASKTPDGSAPDDTEAGPPRSRSDALRQQATDATAALTARLPVLATIIEAAERERATGGGLLAGGVAYRLFFWIVPVGLTAAAVQSLLGREPDADVGSAAGSRGIAAAVVTAERQAMTANHAARWYLLVLGASLSVWFGIGVVRALSAVFALAWGERIRPVRRPVFAGAAFTLLAAALTVSASAMGAAASAIGLGPVALTLSVVAAYSGAALGISAIFPHGDAPARALIPGAIFVSAGGIGVHAFVNIYLAPKLGRSVNTYGLLGASCVILLWLFIIARLITVSAFVNAALWRRRSLDESR